MSGPATEAATQAGIPVENPATGETIAIVEALGPADVAGMVVRAREVQPIWAAVGFEGRAEVLLAARDWMLANAEQVVGTIVGGAVIARSGINRPLWIFAVIQALSNLTYYGLSLAGRNHGYMVFAVVIENFGLGLVSSSLTAYLMMMCNKRFSATQFALLSSLMAASRDVLVAPGGKIAESMGWPSFFMITVAAGIPCLLLLPFIAPWNADVPIGAAEHEETIIPDQAAAAASVSSG